MNQSTTQLYFDGKRLANEIWTLSSAARPVKADKAYTAPDNRTIAGKQSENPIGDRDFKLSRTEETKDRWAPRHFV